MKSKNIINQQHSFKKLIIHFNIDKTIIMRDSLSYDNSDIIVSIYIIIKLFQNFLLIRFVKYYPN